MKKPNTLKLIFILFGEKIKNGILKVNEIESSNQNADILTKALGINQQEYISNRLGLIDVFKGS